MREVVVVGGGITGLAAAYRLVRPDLHVTLIEAGGRLGGAMRTVQIEGVTLEGGPDSFLTRKPWAETLARELGLAADLIATRPEARGASLFWHGRLEPIPAGVVNGVPTDLRALWRSDVLSLAGKLAALMDLVRPPGHPTGDVSLGAFLARRFGREVVERLAAPMLSGIYAGDIWALSLLATAPDLASILDRYGSLSRGLREARRARPPAPGPLFRTLASGLETLPSTLARRLVALGATLKIRTRVEQLAAEADGWVVELSDGVLHADAVVLATPAPVSATLLTAVSAEASRLLAGIPYAHLAVVGLLYPPGRLPVPRTQTGVLVPRQRGIAVTALTYLASKWAYPTPPPYEPIRAFYGRADGSNVLEHDDDTLIRMAQQDVARILGSDVAAHQAVVFRHPAAMPQYLVGHRERVAAIDRALRPHPTLATAGAWRNGVGIPDCIREGEAAAARILQGLGFRSAS
jgi:oxygen-dependent protoporphyrinogen oxidase